MQHRNGANVEDAFKTLQAAGKTPEDLYKALTEQRIDLVFTAHPTQAMRGSVRKKYDKLFHDLTRMLHRPSSVSLVETEADMYADVQVPTLLPIPLRPQPRTTHAASSAAIPLAPTMHTRCTRVTALTTSPS